MYGKDKYHTDPDFRRLVDTMEHFVHENQFTPSELREAAVLASINYESKRIRPPIFITDELEGALKIIRKYQDN